MPTGPFVRNPVEKQWVKILTCDPRTRRIEGILKDYGVIQIALYEVPVAFRWPKEGEWWMVVRENYDWFLHAPLQNTETENPIEELDAGDTQIGVEGSRVVILGELDATVPFSKGHMPHGSNQNAIRPNFTSVEWFGSVIPLNGIHGDTLLLLQ